MSPKTSYEPHMAAAAASSSSLPQSWSSRGPEGLQGRACPALASQRGSVQAPSNNLVPATTLSLGTGAHVVRSSQFLVSSLSIPRAADRGARVPGQLSSLLNVPSALLFLFQLQLWLREQSLGAQAAATAAKSSLQRS